MGLERKLLSI